MKNRWLIAEDTTDPTKQNTVGSAFSTIHTILIIHIQKMTLGK